MISCSSIVGENTNNGGAGTDRELLYIMQCDYIQVHTQVFPGYALRLLVKTPTTAEQGQTVNCFILCNVITSKFIHKYFLDMLFDCW